MSATEAELVQELSETDLVVADTNKFKIKLGIGEDAYGSLKLKNTLQTLWDVKGAGAVGAAAAASPAVATTFFGGGGFLSALGLGAAAATPVGWVVAAAVASGGAYYGVMKVMSGYTSSRVETIPKFINTPIDLLGATLFDMMAGLALKVADFSGETEDVEREAIVAYFAEEWGVSEDYARRALPLLEMQIKGRTLKEMAKALADYQIDNDDCNPTAMKKDIRKFLEEIAYADGECDEREELAIESIVRELDDHLSMQSQLAKSATHYSKAVGDLIQDSGAAAVKTAHATLEKAKGFFGGLVKK
ncbi:TerB family tellurite resistance protein [Sinirhodobacter sp. WL0062]|uniref:TerB family tellurite resistance protein n=1 Tax=Rhodobacter flavimaris TaxID=2907145 RepID=A0ABS8YRB1_9RHOB|nr:TerB family tellurite resistance protein [Sinirhodobacter sp. WL0062]MCE5972419.1 TerB family tellurite resistance protein [Sinirhodobacter sp. WL0062]